MKKHLLPALFVLAAIVTAYSQNVFLKHYTVEDGLLSSEIYATLQDSAGYMWFATSRGAARFDGVNFTNYTVKEGLPTNSIITLFLDRYGTLWFAAYDGSLAYLKNDRLYPYKFNDTLRKLTKFYFINGLYVDKDSNLIIAPNSGGLYKITPEGKVFSLGDTIPTNFFIKKEDNTIIYARLPENKFRKERIIFKGNNVYFDMDSPGLRRFVIDMPNNRYLITKGKELFILSAEGLKHLKTYRNEISGIFRDRQNNIWVSVLYNGVTVYKNGNFNDSIVLLKNKSPIKVFQDHEDSYWIPTTESGIYYLPAFNFYNYSGYGLNQFNIVAIAASGNNLYFSTFDKKLFKIKTQGIKVKHIENIKAIEKQRIGINDILVKNNNEIWLLGSYIMRLYNGNLQKIKPISRGYHMCLANDKNVLTTVSNGYAKFCDTSECFRLTDPRVPTSNSIYQDTRGTVWLGSINGLFSYKDNNLTFWGDKFKVLKTRINDINQIGNYIILATSGAGLAILNPYSANPETIVISTKEQLPSNFVTALYKDKNTIWVATNKGLAKLVIKDSTKLEYRLEKYTATDGLYAEEIREITKSGNTIFLGTSKGLVAFYPDKLRKNISPPKLIIDSILINDRKVPLKHSYNLKANQRNIAIYFKAISYRSGKEVVYRYRLNGFDNQWNTTHNRYAKFPNLPAGEYIFQFTAASDKDIWNTKPITIKFSIKKKFTETLLFNFLVILFITLIIAIILRISYINKHRELQNQKRLLLAEQKALRSQMNPHFIFNALNSIRRYILENDSEQADFYLTSFALLMRKVLDNSKKNFVSLYDEIETLKIYLNLEQMRFDQSFKFSLETDPYLDLHNWMIPPMLIQPFIENAIWHGLAPKKKDGILQISFSREGKYVKCVIEDNGIGRKKAAEISARRKGHKSTGLKNIDERIQLLKKLYNLEINIDIKDLYDSEGNPAGTKVTILLPDFSNIAPIS